jgi:sulfite reductase (ferredoxin)
MIENGILEAEQELYQAKLLVEKHQYSVSVNKSYRAVLAAAKALLVTEGLDPATDADILSEFEERLAPKGVVPAIYRELGKQVGDLGPKDTTADSARSKMEFAIGFVDACRRAADQMGKDLKLAPATEIPTQATTRPAMQEPRPATAPTGAPVYDLRGVACPMNYVKTKLKLELMEAGEMLEVWLDAGEPIKNVPISLKNDGHKVLLQEALEPEAAHYRVLVEKVEA